MGHLERQLRQVTSALQQRTEHEGDLEMKLDSRGAVSKFVRGGSVHHRAPV